jgi:hypothetical protein
LDAKHFSLYREGKTIAIPIKWIPWKMVSRSHATGSAIERSLFLAWSLEDYALSLHWLNDLGQNDKSVQTGNRPRAVVFKIQKFLGEQSPFSITNQPRENFAAVK